MHYRSQSLCRQGDGASKPGVGLRVAKCHSWQQKGVQSFCHTPCNGIGYDPVLRKRQMGTVLLDWAYRQTAVSTPLRSRSGEVLVTTSISQPPIAAQPSNFALR